MGEVPMEFNSFLNFESVFKKKIIFKLFFFVILKKKRGGGLGVEFGKWALSSQ